MVSLVMSSGREGMWWCADLVAGGEVAQRHRGRTYPQKLPVAERFVAADTNLGPPGGSGLELRTPHYQRIYIQDGSAAAASTRKSAALLPLAGGA